MSGVWSELVARSAPGTVIPAMGRKGRKRAGKAAASASPAVQHPASGQKQPRKRARRASDAAAVLAGSSARSGRAPAPDRGNAREKAAPPAAGRGRGKGSSLQQQFRRKLEGAKFRKLNELLYTSSGDDAFQHFKEQPSDFHVVRAVGAWRDCARRAAAHRQLRAVPPWIPRAGGEMARQPTRSMHQLRCVRFSSRAARLSLRGSNLAVQQAAGRRRGRLWLRGRPPRRLCGEQGALL